MSRIVGVLSGKLGMLKKKRLMRGERIDGRVFYCIVGMSVKVAGSEGDDTLVESMTSATAACARATRRYAIGIECTRHPSFHRQRSEKVSVKQKHIRPNTN